MSVSHLGALEGYYEMGVELGFELTLPILLKFIKDFKLSVKESEIASLVGLYGYVDLVRGFNENEWDWFHYAVKKIVIPAVIYIMCNFLNKIQDLGISLEGENGITTGNTVKGKSFLEAFRSPEEIGKIIGDFTAVLVEVF